MEETAGALAPSAQITSVSSSSSSSSATSSAASSAPSSSASDGATEQPPQPQQKKKKKKRPRRKFAHGNYDRYYGYRWEKCQMAQFDPNWEKHDPRLGVMPAELFRGKRCLDIGCNAGFLTIAVAHMFQCAYILGVDIDKSLITKARTILRQRAAFIAAEIADSAAAVGASRSGVGGNGVGGNGGKACMGGNCGNGGNGGNGGNTRAVRSVCLVCISYHTAVWCVICTCEMG